MSKYVKKDSFINKVVYGRGRNRNGGRPGGNEEGGGRGGGGG